METKQQKRIGVIGGMGSLATAHFLARIAALTDAEADQEHAPVVAVTIPQTADRTEAIRAGAGSPAYREVGRELFRALETLAAAGATSIAIPCNTAHEWLPALISRSSVPILHMPQIALVAADRLGTASVSILATEGVRASEIFSRAKKATGGSARLSYPDEAVQETVSSLIAAVKAGREPSSLSDELGRIIAALNKKGKTALVACTELSCITPHLSPGLSFIDALDELALEAIESAGYRTRARGLPAPFIREMQPSSLARKGAI